jgi:predicted dehydrogenase
VLACDERPAVRQAMTERYQVATVADWTEGLKDPRVAAVVVATPAPSHVAITRRALEAGRHVLVEKPLSLDLAGVDELIGTRDRAGRFVAVGYVLHVVPALHAAREFLRAGSFGKLHHVVVTTGQYFPGFRPAYREIYYRDRAQGGGAIQDALTHQANAVEWVAGPTTEVFCDASHQVLEGVEVEDTVNALARNGGVMVSYALNQFQAPNETRWDFHAAQGSVRVELNAQRWGRLARGEADWTWQAAPVSERDQLFVAQANGFLDGCAGRPHPLCTLEEGRQTLRFNLAALRSWTEKRSVTL